MVPKEFSDEADAAHPPGVGETFAGLSVGGGGDSFDPGATVTPPFAPTVTVSGDLSDLLLPTAAAATDPSAITPGSRSLLGPLPRLVTGAADSAFVLLEQVAEGGMGRVNLARQPALNRDVAVKRVRPDRNSHSSVHALLEEARLTGYLQHPSIIPVHALGLDGNGDPMLVMKRVDGVSWRDLIRNPDHPFWGDRRQDRLGFHLDIIIQVCNAVHFAHSRGILNRDLKTENVMLGAFGEVYVLDWGLAVRVNEPRPYSIAGTPAFMAPEMLDPTKPLTVRTDVYLLGGMLHHALTGRYRHAGTTIEQVLAAVVESAPPEYGPELPAELVQLCIRATARDPEVRPADALEFQQACIDYKRHRGSVGLSDMAHQTLQNLVEVIGRLRAAVVQGADPSVLDLHRAEARRLAAEAAFGFRQSLRQWPENVSAQGGLKACLLRTAEFELDERNVFAATTLLADLGAEAPHLQARLTELRASIELQSRANRELSQLRHESSADVALSVRTWVLFILHAVLGSFWLVMEHLELGFTHVAIIGFAASLLVSLAMSFTLLRQTLLANQFNRRILYCLVAFCIFTMIHGSLGIVRDVPVDHLAWGGYLGVGLMFAVMALTMSPIIGVLVPPTMIAAVYCALNPERVNLSLALFNFGCGLSWLIPLGVARWTGRNGDRRDA